MQSVSYKTALNGIAASASLLAFYFVVSSLLGGVDFALSNFVQLWYWMVPLVVGFGIQIGMFFHLKKVMHKEAIGPTAASTGVSTTSMVACCAHHLVDIAPFLGIAAAATFLTKYQSSLLLLGIVSNVLGIIYMASLMSTHASKKKIKALFYALLAIAIVVVFVSFFYTASSESRPRAASTAASTKQTKPLQKLVSEKNSITFEITPTSSSTFQISMSTHSVELDFDLLQITTLSTDTGASYKPLSWEGSPPGGHHRSGTLYFPAISPDAKSIKLLIVDSAEREFSWILA